MSNAPSKLNNYAQSPSRTIVVSAGKECVKQVDGNKTTLVTRNPAPEASPPSTPSRSEKLLVAC